nr:tripartite tricarboxylate transporter permease [Succinivibrio sp.]
MDTIDLIAQGFYAAVTPLNLLAMILATALGICIGFLPGLSAAMGVALLLPITFGMSPATGLIVLGGIYCGAIFGGSVSAILVHTPGTPASAATAIEGYQLTIRGKAAKALTVACVASFAGGLLSCISLYFFSPLLASLAMQFKSPEYFWLSLFGLTIIAGVSSKSMIKGLISGLIGLLISTIGMDPMDGVERFMFGMSTLYNGIDTTCALIGLFSMSQILILAEQRIKPRTESAKIKDSF